ncbi:MAG TPA: class I SAM-dependent methyltransferase [Bryobacteraceae bacterium]|nr:class I SAM-dependent methyltransferase [Bryobacteraceae bacterium]
MASEARQEEIAAIVDAIRERARARHPQGEAPGLGVPLPDLLPILHARDAAAAKVAAIGTVNPRRAGLLNNLIQSMKRGVARALGWFVRDQVEYNRALLTALEATLEAFNEVNRTLAAAGVRLQAAQEVASEARELKDIRSHWITWRAEWEKTLFRNEAHFLKSVSELQSAFDLRLGAADANYRESLRQQHREFNTSIQEAVGEVHQRFWNDLQKIKLDYEQLIHNELRVIRQKAFAVSQPALPAASPAGNAPAVLDIDYTRFADRFRGTAAVIRERQRMYVPVFSRCRNVLDIGCGRGEFLDLLREAGVAARGVDLDAESVAACRAEGLVADEADVFDLLAREPDASFDGIFAAQVVEHMPPHQVPALVKLCSAKLRPGGLLVLETPNPECLAIFATHFYLDPTHQRPVPPALLVFYYEEFGFGGIEVNRLEPAAESMPSINALPAEFRQAFFGGLDYNIMGRKL